MNIRYLVVSDYRKDVVCFLRSCHEYDFLLCYVSDLLFEAKYVFSDKSIKFTLRYINIGNSFYIVPVTFFLL